MDLFSFFSGNFDFLFNWLGDFFSSEIARMTIAFSLAARLHRNWVRKDMNEQFAKITLAIDNVAKQLTEGLALHSRRIDDLTERVNDLESKK